MHIKPASCHLFIFQLGFIERNSMSWTLLSALILSSKSPLQSKNTSFDERGDECVVDFCIELQAFEDARKAEV